MLLLLSLLLLVRFLLVVSSIFIITIIICIITMIESAPGDHEGLGQGRLPQVVLTDEIGTPNPS